MPTELDGLIDLSGQCIVNCLLYKNSLGMWPLIGGINCKITLSRQPHFRKRLMNITVSDLV